jgi:hypothetical protein
MLLCLRQIGSGTDLLRRPTMQQGHCSTQAAREKLQDQPLHQANGAAPVFAYSLGSCISGQPHMPSCTCTLFAQTPSILSARSAQERAQPVSHYPNPTICTLRTLLAATAQDAMMASAASMSLSVLVVIIGAATTVAGQNT